MLATLLLALTSTAVGCGWDRLYFRPVDDAGRERPEGWLPVLSLPLVDDQGEVMGTLWLGSQGIYALALAPGEKPRRVLHVEVLVVNDGDAPLRMEGQSQHVEALTDRPAIFPTQLRVDGELAEALVVEPGASGDADLLFALEGRLEAGHIPGFDLSWRIDSAHASFRGQHPFVPIAPSELCYPRDAYTGIWKGYFFPGHADIPDWGRELFFAPFEKSEPTQGR